MGLRTFVERKTAPSRLALRVHSKAADHSFPRASRSMEPQAWSLVFFLLSIVTSGAAVASGTAWFRSQRRIRELEQYFLHGRAEGSLPSVEEELGQQVAALTATVERLAEGQDFLARYVAVNRLPNLPGQPSDARIVTPH
jgi:hypothetical protein